MATTADEPTRIAAPEAGASDPAAGRRVIPGDDVGAYVIRERIGSGGYGEVFLAVHRILRRRVALKVIHADLAGQVSVADLFLREARLIARFDHPNVVSVYDAGRTGVHLYMAMRYIPGGSLLDLIQRDRAIPEDRGLRIMRDCCAGLAAIHGLGLLHRDIKPANILLETDGRASLTDFGLACFQRERIPGVDGDGMVGGTILYLAPEQLDGREIATPRSDLYSLGITFTGLMTGVVPLAGTSAAEAIRRTVNGELPDPADLRSDLSKDLLTLLREMTAKDADRRPPDALAVLRRVDAMLARAEGRKPYALPAGRADAAQLAAAESRVQSDPLTKALLDAYPGPALVLNDRRQIVAANREASDLFGTGDAPSLVGRRPGEAMGCANAGAGPDGCGTSAACAFCGLGRMISELEQGRPAPVRGESRFSRPGAFPDGAAEFAFCLNSLPADGREVPMTLVTLRDVSAEKRRRVIERSLVDNLLDAAAVVRSIAETSGRVATMAAATGSRKVKGLLSDASRALAEEALFQQHLLAAEAGELQPVWEETGVHDLVMGVGRGFRHHPVSEGRRLVVRCPGSLRVRTDPILLQRAVRNLFRNALEAALPGEQVTVTVSVPGEGGVEIRVHNLQVMPPEVRDQVFRRSFSTKAAEGRGIGLHAARLFVETYLQGRIGFTSEAPHGTTFWIRIPERPRETGAAKTNV
jgi:serine/threonine protein kinase